MFDYLLALIAVVTFVRCPSNQTVQASPGLAVMIGCVRRPHVTCPIVLVVSRPWNRPSVPSASSPRAHAPHTQMRFLWRESIRGSYPVLKFHKSYADGYPCVIAASPCCPHMRNFII